MNTSFWERKRVLVTGHTGFKGGWLSLWLHSMGAQVIGLALPPNTEPSFFQKTNLADTIDSHFADIRDYENVLNIIKLVKPDLVFHLAAQPLVRYSYKNPIETYATNVMGTVHLLEAVRQVGATKVVVNVTTDKCYDNKEWVWGYRESDPLGGYDPYSSSKGCSELVTSAYRSSFYTDAGIALASARAGNVIGGGDWSEDRLIPDLLRSFDSNQAALIRNPQAIRPWQHVLEPLSGYLQLAERLWENPEEFIGAWNFGPHYGDAKTVGWIADRLISIWGMQASWISDKGISPYEANYLKLDISKATQKLFWEPRWGLEIALEKIVEWNRAVSGGADAASVSLKQISEFLSSKR
jgi:CDP-glucose 4,6-dehydratase